MSGAGLLAQALATGVDLAVHEGRVRIRGECSPQLRERLRECREEVLRLLEDDARARAGGDPDDRIEALLERAAIQHEAETPRALPTGADPANAPLGWVCATLGRFAGSWIAEDGTVELRELLAAEGAGFDEPGFGAPASSAAPAEPESPAAIELGRPETWREESIAECHQRILDAGDLIREFARSRWSAEADTWSVEMLAGFYVRDLLGGMEAVLGTWEGWVAVRARIDRQTGPTTIARLWAACAALPSATRQQVIERGDRSQSPPACLRGGGRA